MQILCDLGILIKKKKRRDSVTEGGEKIEREAVSQTLTLSTDRHQLDSLAADEVQGFVHVGDLVETHLAFVGFGQPLA